MSFLAQNPTNFTSLTDIYALFRLFLHSIVLSSILALVACDTSSLPSRQASIRIDARVASRYSDVRLALAAGYIQPLCPTTPGKYHCFAYAVTKAGLLAYHYHMRQAVTKLRYYGKNSLRRVCGTGMNAEPECTSTAENQKTNRPDGYGPDDLQSAYGITNTSGGANRTVGLVESGDAPSLEADLNTYRTEYGLSPCTTGNGCLRKVGQDGRALPHIW